MHDQPFLTPELSHRLAAIDIGTNSVRLVVAEPLRDGKYRVLDEERETTRLGRALNSTERLDPAAVEDALAALNRFKQIAEGLHSQTIRAIATCAVREAKNGEEFRQKVHEQTGLEIEVISAEKEAHLAFYSVRRSFDLSGKNIVLADIGGGSTELVVASDNWVEAIFTTRLGAVRLSEMFGGGQALAGDDFDRMNRWIWRHLKRRTERPLVPLHLLVGSGGTFTSLASMMMAQKKQEGLPVRGYQVSRAELKHLLDSLRKSSPKQRRNVPGLSPDRADIIVPGLAVIDQVMRRFKVNVIQVHNRGVRDGLLLSMIDSIYGSSTTTVPDRDALVDQFAQACGADMRHGRQVAMLAGQIFDQLAEPFHLNSKDRTLLGVAARLQDVGYLINYNRHHKHSYHLILNSRLEGFQPNELELIANLARYHRRAEPKMKHRNFQQLSRSTRNRVRQLAAILRLAGGLDRSHSQSIRDLTLSFDLEQKTAELTVHADQYPEVDIWAVRRRGGLFEKVFGQSLSVEWKEPPAKQKAV